MLQCLVNSQAELESKKQEAEEIRASQQARGVKLHAAANVLDMQRRWQSPTLRKVKPNARLPN